MKYSWGIALSFLSPLVAASSSSDDVRVLLFPSANRNGPSKHQKLDAETAKLIFARRLGLSQFYDLGNIEDEQLAQIDRLGGSSPQLLHSQAESGPFAGENGLLIVEGVEYAQDAISHVKESTFDEFTISGSPTLEETEDLRKSFDDHLKKIHAQDHSIRPAVCSQVHDLVSLHAFIQEEESCLPWSFPSLKGAHDLDPQQVERQLNSFLHMASESNYGYTVIFVPRSQSSISKRTTNAYGDIMGRQGKPAPELVLSEGSETSSARLSFATGSSQANSNSSTPVSGILPACFSSKETCEASTNGCSGHGSCYRKYQYKSGDDEVACFTCKCEPSVQKIGNSTKTTTYGGSACQKIDISVPFWLFAGFTISILFVLTWAIGLLYSMGNEDLPSVIGAGVSGPAKK